MLLPPLDLNAINYHVQIIHHAAQSLSGNGKLILAGFGENPDTGEKLFPLVEHFDIGDISGMVSTIIRLSPETHRNLYIPLAVFRPDLARGKKGSKADIVAVTGVVADFDDDAASEYISRLPFPPHYVLETSAERYQAFYLFELPVLSDPASSVAARLQAYAKCDHGTADISHVWRIPGTLNWPNSKKVREGRSRNPQLVRILEGGNHVVR